MKSHFDMGDLVYICCIFSKHLFLGKPLNGCFLSLQVSVSNIIDKSIKINKDFEIRVFLLKIIEKKVMYSIKKVLNITKK